MMSEVLRRGKQAQQEEEERLPLNLDIEARKLLDAFELLNVTHVFKRGDLVTARSFSPYRFPMCGAPGIVWEVLENPIPYMERDSTDANSRILLDIVIGVYSEDAFCFFHMPSRYLEPYTGPVADPA